MQRIQDEFTRESGEVVDKLDNSSVFRQADARQSIRLRSWAIHDGILGEPFSNVTMYKYVGQSAGINNAEGTHW
jgi:hypothetical protein